MAMPSSFSTVAFVLVVAAVAVMVVWGTHAAGRGLGEAPEQTRRWSFGTAAALLLWMAATGAVSASGVLEAPGLPPRAMLFMGGCNLAVIVLALSRVGARWVDGLPIAALVGFHAFRLPLELVLHRWYVEGVLPVQMTYSGFNLDIVTGILGLVVGLWLWRRGVSRAAVWAFNLVGFGLLVNVAGIAILSSPFPFRVFMNDPAVLLVFHFPYGWILPMCVAPALMGHVLVFRWLWRSRAH
ncbi:MAG: hypothetical protein MJE77_05350 [Proteobacteria bacterium]|nr:hypothetical protein [Pseudomonadota bacterium]